MRRILPVWQLLESKQIISNMRTQKMHRPMLRPSCAPTSSFPILTAVLLGLLVGSPALALDDLPEPPLVDRTLTGSVDLGDQGRFVGAPLLGTVNVSSDNLLPSEEGTPTARTITINEGGFAWTSNGLLLRNGTGSDLVFDGSNPASQTHELEVYFYGTNQGPIPGVPLGEFAVANFSLGDDPVNQVVNADGNSVQSFGGFWEQSAVYRNDAGEVETQSSVGGNPFNANQQGEVLGPLSAPLSRTTSSTPAAFDDEIRPIFSAPLFRVDEESLPLQRTDALFDVEPLAGDNAGQLDLSGIEVSVSGQSIVDRGIFGGTVNLGRFIRDDSTIEVDRSDSVTLNTSGTDATRTRLSLDPFSVGGDGEVSAELSNATNFDNESATATVDLSGTFEIDRNEIGTNFIGHDVGNSISSQENLLGENTQDRLDVGYRYSVLDNNNVVSDDITVFKIGNFDTSGTRITNHTVEEEFDIKTHTNLNIVRGVVLDNTTLQTVTLSEGNGITGEGLEGENVIAETTFDVHTLEIAPTQLETTEGLVGEGQPITIENTASTAGLTATAFLRSANRNGSDRWFFPASTPLSFGIGAGETLTLTPTFDETGLEAGIEDGSLGRNFRTEFSIEFQDGREFLAGDIVPGTQLADPSLTGFGSDRFNILGSAETRQEFNFLVERAVEQEAASGSLTLAAGESLRDVGLNLTNTAENTTAGFNQTTVEILDGVVGAAEGLDVSIEFANLTDALVEETEAQNFDLLTSDIARIEGLDENLFTLQLNFNLYEDLQVADASLLWFDEGDIEDSEGDAWVNAILGNSDIESYDLENDLVTLAGAAEAIALSDFLDSRSHALSYSDYLFSLDEGEEAALGAFGFDDVNGVVWAVLDHNSSFASTATAVPEPTSAVLLIAGASAFCLGRRRQIL